jgi:hypothetical protein
VEILAVIKSLLLSNRRLRAFIIPPLFRLHPTNFKDDIATCNVSALIECYLFLFLCFILIFQSFLTRFCETIRRAEIVKGPTVNKGMLQKDGVSLFPSAVNRYIETVIPPIRLAIDAYSKRKSEDADSSLAEVRF